jgi:hypothetical protein
VEPAGNGAAGAATFPSLTSPGNAHDTAAMSSEGKQRIRRAGIAGWHRVGDQAIRMQEH